jgi:hypothetical protein
MEFCNNATGIESLMNVIKGHTRSEWEQQRYTVTVVLFAPSELQPGSVSHILTAVRKNRRTP